jgi:uncharacterized integral membrane protein
MFFLIFFMFLLIGGALTLIAMQNSALLVHLSLFSWQTPNLPIGVWLIGAFLLGAIVLYFASVLSAIGDRREIKALRQQVLVLEEQMAILGQIASEGFPTAYTGPPTPVPDVNTSQSGANVPTSPKRKFRP